MLTFHATVSSRSSRALGGPPGEAEVQALNPERSKRILAVMKWQTLAPGSLNLEVAENVVHRLLLFCPVIREDGEHLKYPPAYANIPKLRVGYLYFSARLQANGKVASVLIRRAVNPLPNRLEAFSEHPLRETLALSDGDIVTCEIEGSAV